MPNLSYLLQKALEKNASDLHLSTNQPPLLRIDGVLKPLGETRLDQEELESMLYAIMCKEQIDTFTRTYDLDFGYTSREGQRCRVNLYHQHHGIGATFRIIPSHPPTFTSLQLPAVVKTFCHKTEGLILITGPTGAGKTSSLAAFVHEINRTQAKHIVSIEDPIEYLHISQKSLITQREVHRDTLHFQSALRAALREDPDIICVTELRDLESIRLALTAAETGHLVLATLHTGSACKAIDRVIDVFPGNEKEMVRTMLSESLHAIIAQKLYLKPEGGRSAVFEILIATPAIRHLIRENKPAQIYSAMQTGQAMGMCTFPQ